jgi:hypothetical protein
MKVYLAAASNDEGENLDLFVVADCSIEAGQMQIPGQPLPDAVKGVVDWSLLQREEPQLTYPDTSGWWGDDED